MDGLIDTNKFIFSTYLRLDGNDGAVRNIIRNDNGRFIVQFNSANQLQIYGQNTVPTIILNRSTAATYTASATWLHILIAVDLSGPTIQLYVNDSSVSTTGTILSGDIDLTGGGWTVGANSGGTQQFEGALGPTFFYPGLYLDLSVAANRRLFISSEGGWVNLGPNGRVPFGSPPHLYMLGNSASEFAANLGDGGAFTVQGSPEAYITSDQLIATSPAFYTEFTTEEGNRFYRLKFQGQNSTDSGSIEVGLVSVGESVALLRNPNQQDFEKVESLTQRILETADVRERWSIKKEKLKRRAYSLRFLQTDEQQSRWEQEIWERTEFGGKGLVFVPDNQDSVVIHSRPVRNQFTIRKRTADVQVTDLGLTESPHGIVTE
jgi:hypothetical protein